MRSDSTTVKSAAVAEIRNRPDSRKTTRHRANQEVQVATSAVVIVTMTVGDISLHGCSLGGDTSMLRLGMILSVRLDAETPVQVITRWVRDGVAGAEFFRPLSSSQAGWLQLLSAQADC